MNILAFDIESCTGRPTDGSLCSFGYVFVNDGKIVDSGDILVNPLPKAFTLGGYGQTQKLKLAYPVSHFRKQPRFDGRYCAIKALFDKADIALGFSIANDVKYLNNACDMFALPRIKYKFLDVQMLASLIIKDLKNTGLKAIAERYGVEFLEHRSDEDARATYEIFLKLIEEYGKPLSEIVDDFGLVAGENVENGHTGCYSKWQVRERLQASTRSVRRILINYYNDSASVLPQKNTWLIGKTVAMAEAVYLKDLDLARKIVCSTYASGGIYDSSILKCDLYVTCDGDKMAKRVPRINPRECKVITVKEFERGCGEFTDMLFDDFDILEKHYSAFSPD